MTRDDRLAHLLSLWQSAGDRGEPVEAESLCADDPDLLPELRQRINFVRRMTALGQGLGACPDGDTVDIPATVPDPRFSETITGGQAVPSGGRPVGNLPPGYEYVRELGRGGMGVVLLARQTAANRLVAVKMLLSGNWAGDAELARFRAEARAVAGIAHPNVVAVYDVGEHAGLPYFTLEFCPAGSLRDRMNGEPLPPREAAGLVQKVASGVAAAHARGVVHRDLKPHNILFRSAEEAGSDDATIAEGPGQVAGLWPKVADFGLAKGGGDEGLTTTGSVLGTPAYMAPEQAAGDAKHVGPPADVWALGAVLYEALTGRPPFQGPSMLETLELVRTADPVGPRLLNPAIPRDLETVCLKCLRKDPGQRYPSAAELAADLGRFLDGRAVVARPVGQVERVWKWTRRNPRVAGLLASLAAVILVALATTTYLWRQASDREREATYQRGLAEASRVRAEQSEAETRRALAEATAAQERATRGEQRARLEATRARSAAEFLGGLFEASDPLEISGATAAVPRLRGEQLTAPEMLRRGARTLDTRTDLSPDARASLALRIGNSFLAVGDFPNAARYLTDARTGLEKLLGPDHTDLADVYHAQAWLEQLRGNYDESEALYRRAADLQARLDQTDPRNVALLTATWIKLGILLAEKGDDDGAARFTEQARFRRAELARADSRYNRALGEAYFASAVVASEEPGLPGLLRARTFADEGIKLVLGGGDDPLARAIQLFQQGLMHAYLEKNGRAAERKLTESLELTRSVLGPRHLYATLIQGQLAFVQDDFGDPALAEKNCRECLAVGKEQQVNTHPKAGLVFVRLARLLARTGRPAEAKAVLTEWLAGHEAENPDGLKHADALTEAADVYTDLGDEATAVKFLERAEAVYRAKLKGRRRTAFASNQQQLGWVYTRRHKWAEAEARFDAALRWVDTTAPHERGDNDYLEMVGGLARAMARQGKYSPDLEARLAEARNALRGRDEKRDRSALRTTLALRQSEYHRGRGQLAPAIRAAREAEQAAMTPESVYAVAVELTACAAQAKGPEAEALKASAVKALRTAVRRGLKGANRIPKAAAFAPLRDRADFRTFVGDLESSR